MGSPTQRSLALLRERGYTAAVVERWNPYARIRQDLFGCVDIVAVGSEGRTLAVQACAYASVSARVKKCSEAEALPAMQRSGWEVVVQGWKKVKGRWQVREVWL